MIDTSKYEGHLIDKAVEDNSQVWVWKNWMLKNAETIEQHKATAALLSDAPLLLEFIQKIVKEWCKPNQCNQAFGKDVRQLMYEYGLITFNEETRRYEVKE